MHVHRQIYQDVLKFYLRTFALITEPILVEEPNGSLNKSVEFSDV